MTYIHSPYPTFIFYYSPILQNLLDSEAGHLVFNTLSFFGTVRTVAQLLHFIIAKLKITKIYFWKKVKRLTQAIDFYLALSLCKLYRISCAMRGQFLFYLSLFVQL